MDLIRKTRNLKKSFYIYVGTYGNIYVEVRLDISPVFTPDKFFQAQLLQSSTPTPDGNFDD